MKPVESVLSMRETFYIFLLMILAVPLAGELKFYPFADDFRVSFGTTAFFFFLLWIRKIPAMVSGIVVGVSVVCFRIMLDALGQNHLEINSLIHHLPAFVFYFSYACLFYLARINSFHHRPLLVGVLGVGIEIISNLIELTYRWQHVESVFTIGIISKITLIAIIRTFFVLGFFNMIQLRQAIWMEEQQRSRNQRTLMLISSLYEESIQLKKTLNHVEGITRDCYDLYRDLQAVSDEVPESYAKRVLHIAGQVHEIKKDNQRIYAGLSRMISNENATDYLSMEELGLMVVRTNQKYAQLLAKEIAFELNVQVDQGKYHIYTTLSLMNNLVTNAVEAIKERGKIRVSIEQQDEWAVFRVRDNGPGITVKNKELLFKPGFTTKYDVTGKPSTGIGLSYVKEMVESLEGTIELETEPGSGETEFTIRLPIAGIMQKGG